MSPVLSAACLRVHGHPLSALTLPVSERLLPPLPECLLWAGSALRSKTHSQQWLRLHLQDLLYVKEIVEYRNRATKAGCKCGESNISAIEERNCLEWLATVTK